MRVLSYLVLLLMFSVASAQTPTILQGDYISNVFGNSNFILNPNAQTSNCTTSGTMTCANVTVTNASITRVTTTPLVARTEFNVAITSANGTATWATRAFDAGMKGQNCEARFTYRGFAATSKVHVKQGANTVASLNLTPATDPRIASINFPCGDLSAATTFVVTDTAILAGTNEIGGIYTGLATNMANVAQAEFYGSLQNYGASCLWSANGASAIAADNDCSTYVKQGADIQPVTRVPAITYTPTKSGNYQIAISGYMSTGTFDVVQCSVYENGVQKMPLANMYSGDSSRTNMENRFSITANFNQTAGTSYTYDIRCISGTNRFIISRGIEESLNWTVYRFPTSSELVVTPERQNTFGSVYYNRSGDDIQVRGGIAQSNTYATFNDSLWTSGRDFRGTRCEAPITGDDIGCQIKNMPVGTYKATVSGVMYETNSSAGNTICSYILQETTTSKDVTTAYGSYNNTVGGLRSNSRTMTGTFQNTSVGDRNFIVRAAKTFDTTTSNLGTCGLYVSNTGTDVAAFNITIEPLDQPSNSALYVQGPVLGAQTGAAIPAGYVGEVKSYNGSATGVTLSSTFVNSGSITLPAGVWSCSGITLFNRNSATFTSVSNIITTFSDASSGFPAYSYDNQSVGRSADAISATFQVFNVGIRPIILRSNGSQITWPDGVTRGTNVLYIMYYLGSFTSGTPQQTTTAECVRLN